MPRPPSKRARGFYRYFFIPADPWVGRRAAVRRGTARLSAGRRELPLFIDEEGCSNKLIAELVGGFYRAKSRVTVRLLFLCVFSVFAVGR